MRVKRYLQGYAREVCFPEKKAAFSVNHLRVPAEGLQESQKAALSVPFTKGGRDQFPREKLQKVPKGQYCPKTGQISGKIEIRS